MLNKKSKLDTEKENKENVNNLSNCSSIKFNLNLLKDSQNRIDPENKKKLFLLKKEEAAKKSTKQNLFLVKKNSTTRKETYINTRSLNDLDMDNIKKEILNKTDKNHAESNSDKCKNSDNLNAGNRVNVNSELDWKIFPKQNQNSNIDSQTKSHAPLNYINRENSSLIKIYGADSYQYIKQMEDDAIEKNFLYKHKINPEIRSKMVDWMIEVLAVYKSEAETFFLAIHIMDSYINHCNFVLRSEDVHLIGVTSMFIATKFEDIIPIRITSFVNKISHGVFTEKQIKNKERKLLEVIGFDRLISTSIYEFIKTYFFDFFYNNKKNLRQLNLLEVVEKFENVSIFLAKMSLHFECFYEFKRSLIAVACVITAFDLIRTNNSVISEEGEKFLREWIMFLIQESSFPADYIGDVYTKLVECYGEYDKVTYISRNLKKYFPMILN